MATKRSKRKPKTHHPKTALSPSDFCFTLTRVAVTQICRSVGYKRGSRSALDALTLVTTKYLETLVRTSASFCNASNRTQSNLFDLTNALRDLIALQDGGFPGASALPGPGSCFLDSSVLRVLAGFVVSSEEIPFAKPIQRREDQSKREKEQQHFDSSPPTRGAHVPEWLPCFPEISGEEEKCERRAEEELWENSESVLGKERKEALEERNGGKLMKEREKVRFVIRGRKRFSLSENIFCGKGKKSKGKKKVENVKKRKR